MGEERAQSMPGRRMLPIEVGLAVSTALARLTEDQHVIQRLLAPFRRFDVDLQLLAHRLLAEILVQTLRPDAGLKRLVLAGAGSGDDAGVVHWGRERGTGNGERKETTACANAYAKRC